MLEAYSMFKCERETLAFTGQKANHDVTLIPSQHNPLTLWEVLIWWVYISTAVKDFCSASHTNWILTTKRNLPKYRETWHFLGLRGSCCQELWDKRPLIKHMNNFDIKIIFRQQHYYTLHQLWLKAWMFKFRFLTFLEKLPWRHSLSDNWEWSKGHKQIIVFVMWKTLALLSGIFPLQTTFEVGLVRAPPQDSHPPIPSACTVWAQRTTSWAEERNRQQCLLELENWLHNLNFSLTTVLLH